MMNSPIKLSDEAHSQLASLNAEAATGRGMWIAFNSLMAYLAVSVISVTHEDLLLDNALTLPIIGANMPLSWLAILGPALLLVIYFSVLLEHSLIARKAIALNELLSGIGGERSSQNIRLNATTYFFAQNMVSPKQNWLLRRGMSLIGWLTLDFFPLAVLVLFQLTFLPLQSNAVTWTQRFAVFLACVMGFTFGLVCRQPHLNFLAALRLLFAKSKFTLTLLSALTIGTSMFSLFIATGAQERKNWNDYSSIVQGTWLFDRAHDGVSERQASWFSQTLVVPRIDAREEKNKKLLKSLRGRSLVGADLSNSNLASVDFTASDLTGADFSEANLVRAKFECANRLYVKKRGEQKQEVTYVDKGKVVCSNLRGANFSGASLAFTEFIGINVEGASFRNTDVRLSVLRFDSAVGLDFRDAKIPASCCHGWKVVDLRGAKLWEQIFYQLGDDTPEFEDGPPIVGGALADLRSARLRLTPLTGLEKNDPSVPQYVMLPDMRSVRPLEEDLSFDDLAKLKESADSLEQIQITDFESQLSSKPSNVESKYLDLLAKESESMWSDASFLKRRTGALVSALKDYPFALDSFVGRYTVPKKLEQKQSQRGAGLFLGTANAQTTGFGGTFGDAGDSGCCGCCSGPIQGDPNFDTKLFAQSLQKLPIYNEVDEETQLTLNVWAAAVVVQNR